ncbi:MAG: transcription initiation factor IIB [archaeon]
MASCECGGEIIEDFERGVKYCKKCGKVIEEELLDRGAEWRAYDWSQRTEKSRAGAPIDITRPNKGLPTEIDRFNKDWRSEKITSPEMKKRLTSLRKWNKMLQTSSSVERNLAIAMGELSKICATLGLSNNIKEAAAMLYRKAVSKGVIRGRLIEAVVAAIVYMVCRQYGIPRTLEEIAEKTNLSKKDIGRTYRYLKKDLGITMPLSNPIHYIPRFASELNLYGEVQERAIKILEEAMKKKLISGRGPTGIAAAAIYIASVQLGEHRTQKEVAEVAGVTEVTIRNRYRELKELLKLDLPN